MEENDNRKDRSMKKIGDDISGAMEKCVDALSLTEFSRITGVRIELLRRFVNKQARIARAETWDKLYPTLKPFLEGPETTPPPPPRIGPAYRRHNELVGMISDQKVLLDEFAVLSSADQKKIIADFIEAAGGKTEPSSYVSLSSAENKLMGAFLALPQDVRDKKLQELTELAIRTVQHKRRELF